MLALNPVAPERFLEQEGGNQCEQVARRYLREALDRFGDRIKAVRWGEKHVACGVKGTLGYVEWYDDDTLLVHVPYPDTPYRLETFLHELGHVWLDHNPDKSCNGKKSRCRPGNREEYEAENFALTAMRKEGIEIDACTLSDAQDNVVDKLFRDAEAGRPVSRAAIQFVEINDRLKAHGGWESFLEAVEDRDMPVINPATREQYRLAQAVVHGTARFPTRMTRAAAQKLIDDTPPYLRSRYMRNPAEAAEEVYEEFHGAPSEHVTEVSETEHYHSHLAELGILKGLKFRTVDGQDDVTLDFDCEDCDHEQSGNLFGFGGGGKKVSGSSRLMREAFEAGYNGSGGYRGTQEFREWLEHAAGDQDLTRSFKKSLQREYMRGMKNWEREGEVARQLGKSRPKGSASAARGTKYATAVARRNAEEFRVSKYSKFIGYVNRVGYGTRAFTGGVKTAAEALDRAQAFADRTKQRVVVVWQHPGYEGYGKEEKVIGTVDPVSANPRKGPIAQASEFAGSMAHGAAAGVDSFFTGNPAITRETVSRMTAGQINKELDKIEKQQSQVNDELIEAGFGHLRMSEIAELDHPLAHRHEELDDKFTVLRNEVARRYGPGAPSRLPSGRMFGPLRNPAGDDGPVLLCSNERENQLYLVGGDQSVDLDKLKLDAQHDSVILGECWAIAYSTKKEFDDFKRIEYVHTFGPEDLYPEMDDDDDLWEDAQPPDDDAFNCGVLPTLRYDVLNQTLHFDGGSYFVTDKGIED